MMFFFRNDEKTACDTKISSSLATVWPNDIIVIIFRLDVLLNVSLSVLYFLWRSLKERRKTLRRLLIQNERLRVVEKNTKHTLAVRSIEQFKYERLQIKNKFNPFFRKRRGYKFKMQYQFSLNLM